MSDAELWRGHFIFGAWRHDRPRPVCERPYFEPAKIASLKRRYLDMAGDKRLVIKNPFGLARVDMLKIMFPEALFIFAMRAPWSTIRSATIKGNGSYVVPTEFVNSLPHDHILRAAATWAEAIDVCVSERDANWHLVRYEEMIACPHAVISDLFKRIGLKTEPSVIGAAGLPEARNRDFSLLKYQMRWGIPTAPISSRCSTEGPKRLAIAPTCRRFPAAACATERNFGSTSGGSRRRSKNCTRGKAPLNERMQLLSLDSCSRHS